MDKTFKRYNHSNRLMEQKTNHHVIECVKIRRKQAPQGEANVCRTNAISKTSLIECFHHDVIKF